MGEFRRIIENAKKKSNHTTLRTTRHSLVKEKDRLETIPESERKKDDAQRLTMTQQLIKKIDTIPTSNEDIGGPSIAPSSRQPLPFAHRGRPAVGGPKIRISAQGGSTMPSYVEEEYYSNDSTNNEQSLEEAPAPEEVAPEGVVPEEVAPEEEQGTLHTADELITVETPLVYKYNPESGVEVTDRKQMIALLEKALAGLKKEERAQEQQEIYPLPRTLYDLLINVVLNDSIDLSTILSIQFNKWDKIRSRTSIFEALWIIVIGLGCIDRFPIENIQLVDWREVNKVRLPKEFKSTSNSSKPENIVNIFKSMPFGTRSGGVSDITFYYTEKSEEKEKPVYIPGCGKESCMIRPVQDKVYISSVKFFELDIKKNINKFDISELIAASEILTKAKMNCEILLFVRDNTAVSNIVEQARKRYIANRVEKYNIFGEKTLLSAVYLLRKKVAENIRTDIPTTVTHMYGREEPPKTYLQLRFHQELIVEKTYNYVTTTQDTKKTVLIGVLPRGGKTYICGGIISKLKPTTVLVLTHVPKETNKQFLDDLFRKFEDFSEYTVKYLKEEESNEEYIPGKRYIIFTSYQLLKRGYSDKRDGREIRRKILKALVDKALVPDICFLDEAHFGSGGNEAKEIYKQFDSKTVRILMTATYRRPYYLFDRPTLFFWDYQDIQCGKRLNNGEVYDAFRKKHLLAHEDPNSTETIFDKVIENQRMRGYGISKIQQIYSKFPDIETIDSQFEETAKQAFADQLLDDSSKGFSMEAILAVNSKKDIPTNITNAYTLFINPGLVGKFLNYIQPRSGSYVTSLRVDGGELAVPHIAGDLGDHFNIMDRIYSDSEMAGNRLSRGEPHTQIWFIPPSNGIQKRILALASLLLAHPWFSEHFCVIGVSGGESDKIAQPGEASKHISIDTFVDGKCINIGCANSEDLKECIEEQERKNRCSEPPKGTIILTGYMLRMGISLGCADVVMMFDDDTSEDATTQKRYRALTESEGKKKSYVVDLNPRRSIRAMYNEIEGVKQSEKEPSGKIYQTVINTFGINSDRFLFASPGGKTLTMETLIHNLEKENESMTISKDIIALQQDATDLTKSFDDAEIDEILKREFETSFMKTMDIRIQKEIRQREEEESGDNGLGGGGKRRIVLGEQEGTAFTGAIGGEGINESAEPQVPTVPVPTMTPQQRFDNFKKIIDTTLKVIAFTYDASTSSATHTLMNDNPEVQELVYMTLLSRGLVKEVMIHGHKRSSSGKITPPLNAKEMDAFMRLNEEQRAEVVKSIVDSLGQMSEKKTNYVYRGMKAKADDPSIDQQKILEYIDKHLSPTTELKDTYGEVFTPMKLVNEMLDSLEKSDPTLFEDKNKKWLDPANGMGNFPVAVFYRLLKNLKGISRNPEERAEYIVKNMLYMVELQKENSAKARKIFKKLAPGVDPNIITANTLTEFLVTKDKGYVRSFGESGPVTFDVIMGNPPFNPPKGDTGSSGNSIWPNFVMKSFSLLNDGGHLVFVHPPGWKKPTDEVFKPETFAKGNYTGQIRQGQLWQVLKDSGVFKFIYTNDQKSKTIGGEYLPHFPAVDYYVYQKGGDKSGCDTKNVFLGTIDISNGVKLNYNLKYLPNLITKQTQEILDKITSKDGDKTNFIRGIDERGISWSGKVVDWLYDSNKSGFQYKKHGMTATASKSGQSKEDTVTVNKVVINFGGGINSYNVKYIRGADEIGVLDMTMYSKVDSDKEGKRVEVLFRSDIVKFIFLITQYASGKMTKNEPLVANSITIPPEGTVDYYKFFGIEEHKKYIEDMLAHYETFKAPKRVAKTEKKTGKASQQGGRITRKKRA